MFDLSLEVLRVVEDAAIASARTMGMGDPHTADQAAVESMRRCLDSVAIDGTIVIGEGERDKAPMLFVGEPLGRHKGEPGALQVDIAVDPLEGTNLCATGAPDASTGLKGLTSAQSAALKPVLGNWLQTLAGQGLLTASAVSAAPPAFIVAARDGGTVGNDIMVGIANVVPNGRRRRPRCTRAGARRHAVRDQGRRAARLLRRRNRGHAARRRG